MKTKLFQLVSLFAFAIFILYGCAGEQIKISETGTNKAIAYGAGKAMGFAIVSLDEELDSNLSIAWRTMMAEQTDGEVSSTDMILFYNLCISLIAGYTDDPYGLIGDLGAMLMIFGAEYSDEGQLALIQPVPVEVLKWFEAGYKNGRMVAQIEKEK